MAVEMSGMDDVIRRLEAMRSRMGNLMPVLEVALADTTALIDDSFEHGADPAGSPWAVLAPSTERKRRGTAPYKKLVDTGMLRRSVHGRADARSMIFGVHEGIGIFHQYGTTRMPQRRFLPIVGSVGSTQLDRQGAAGIHWSAVRAMIVQYIRTGVVS